MQAFNVVEFFSINQVVANAEPVLWENKGVANSVCHPDFNLLYADKPDDFKIASLHRKGKFIQLVMYNPELKELVDVAKNIEFIVFMPFIEHYFWYHAAILKEFLTRLHLSGGYPHPYQHAENHEYCEFYNRELKVIGGGFYELDPDCFTLRLSSKSTAYGRYDAGRIRKQFDKYSHQFSHYQLFIS